MKILIKTIFLISLISNLHSQENLDLEDKTDLNLISCSLTERELKEQRNNIWILGRGLSDREMKHLDQITECLQLKSSENKTHFFDYQVTRIFL